MSLGEIGIVNARGMFPGVQGLAEITRPPDDDDIRSRGGNALENELDKDRRSRQRHKRAVWASVARGGLGADPIDEISNLPEVYIPGPETLPLGVNPIGIPGAANWGGGGVSAADLASFGRTVQTVAPAIWGQGYYQSVDPRTGATTTVVQPAGSNLPVAFGAASGSGTLGLTGALGTVANWMPWVFMAGLAFVVIGGIRGGRR